MNPSLFSLAGGQINKTFTSNVPALSGAPVTALNGIGENFRAIGTAMVEGNISPEYGEFAVQKLYEAQLAVTAAIQHGWNGGTKQYS